MIRVLDFFCGIGAFDAALDRLGVEYELVDAVDVDKYAVASFNAIHGTDFEPQDISEWDKEVGKIDIMWQSSPCQDLSVAGKRQGAEKGSGTRSSLVWEVIRIVEKIKPRIVIWENVKGLTSKKNLPILEGYMRELGRLGYTSYYKVLNSKHFLIPQNRERCFTVSVLGDLEYEFPNASELELRLKDVLENNVEEKYYLTDEQIKKIKFSAFNQARTRIQGEIAQTLLARDYKDPKVVKVGNRWGGNHQAGQIYSKEGLSPTLDTAQGGGRIPSFVEPQPIKRRRSEYGKEVRKAYENHELGHSEEMRETYLAKDGIMPALTASGRERKIAEPFIVASRGRADGEWAKSEHYQKLEPRADGLTNTISSVAKDNYVAETSLRVRKLTPKECWRLQGFHDSEFDRAEKANSNSQLYKQAGNSVTVSVIVAILAQLGIGGTKWNDMDINEKNKLVFGKELWTK